MAVHGSTALNLFSVGRFWPPAKPVVWVCRVASPSALGVKAYLLDPAALGKLGSRRDGALNSHAPARF